MCLAVNGDNRIVAFVCFCKTRVVDDRGMYLRRSTSTRLRGVTCGCGFVRSSGGFV